MITILIILLVLGLVGGAMPFGAYGGRPYYGGGYYAGGGIGLILLILVILLIAGHRF